MEICVFGAVGTISAHRYGHTDTEDLTSEQFYH